MSFTAPAVIESAFVIHKIDPFQPRSVLQRPTTSYNALYTDDGNDVLRRRCIHYFSIAHSFFRSILSVINVLLRNTYTTLPIAMKMREDGADNMATTLNNT